MVTSQPKNVRRLDLDYLDALVLVVWFEKFVTPEQLSELETQVQQE